MLRTHFDTPAVRRAAGNAARSALLLASMMVLGAPAWAAKYYVTPEGSDSNTGTSITGAWATIGKANSVVLPGDVVIVFPGIYSQFPRPSAPGTPGSRITFVGSLSSPGSVVVNGSATVSGSYVTIKGFKLTSDLNITGVRDSVAYCVLESNRPQLAAADDCVLANCTIIAQRFWVVGAETDTSKKAERDTIIDCNFTLSPQSPGSHTMRFGSVEDALFKRCRFVIDVAAAATDASPNKFFLVKRSRFVDCYWNITNRCTSGCDEAGWFVLRDVTQNNTFLRDSIILNGPGQTCFMVSGSGTYPNSVLNNNFESCVIKQVGPSVFGAAMTWQNGAWSDTLKNCVIAGEGAALNLYSLHGEVLVDHCTIVGMSPWGGTVNLNPDPTEGNITFTNNIFMTGLQAARVRETIPFVTTRSKIVGHIAGDRNLYYSRMSRDSSIYIWEVGPSAPGAGKAWNNLTGADGHSIYGAPNFLNSSNVSSFDAHLQSGSAAVGIADNGGDAGAYPFVPAGPDVTPPAAITDLHASVIYDTSLVLAWTSTGDDDDWGTATTYELRWSTQPITSANFSSAQLLITGAPQPSGFSESFVKLGLAASSTYYFAIKAIDEVGNQSSLSNVFGATTSAADVTPPAAVRDLNTSGTP